MTVTLSRTQYRLFRDQGSFDVLQDAYFQLAQTLDALLQEKAALREALQGIMKLIEEGKLVRDIRKDDQFLSFFQQSVELVKVLGMAQVALAGRKPDA